MANLNDRLLASEEPCIRFKVAVNVLGERPDSAKMRRLRGEIRDCPRVNTLLGEWKGDGTLPGRPCSKSQGAYWVLGFVDERCDRSALRLEV
jgi:hypothetical protein